ncbi:Uncharacterized protein YrrD, contains PRC-barrel domain [Carboxydocella sporoproducens DSM 16521]|uniref:Uncharacterized protein YrrD, contains PRC-barrel domain n=2 Tax=Carboxydocella TaxID=178898 RepID=A0A1T4PR25_9FIRM|nr:MULTISPECIES: PRC-barrel domain-containing protein [Carboxydocella]AVX19692.1 Uncharacterized protein YrrD, contains PRC-barrel domain [Carboxydocella thermautotrophica]SJZ93859.1 Uncharacterized protein YrrD, contains PRC-barrel domain [Carboxydocella sporoproducens DSM 16521]
MEKNLCRGRHLTGLPVYNPQGEMLGRVRQLAVDEEGQLRALATAEDNWYTWEQLLDLREDGLVVAGEALPDCMVACPNWLEQPLYDRQKQEIGLVGDLVLDKSSGKLAGIELARSIFDDLWQGRTEIPWQQLTWENGQLIWLESEKAGQTMNEA